MQHVFAILVGGVLPFGAVFIELFFILSSIWLHQVSHPYPYPTPTPPSPLSILLTHYHTYKPTPSLTLHLTQHHNY